MASVHLLDEAAYEDVLPRFLADAIAASGFGWLKMKDEVLGAALALESGAHPELTQACQQALAGTLELSSYWDAMIPELESSSRPTRFKLVVQWPAGAPKQSVGILVPLTAPDAGTAMAHALKSERVLLHFETTKTGAEVVVLHPPRGDLIELFS